MNAFISLANYSTETLNVILDEADSLFERWQADDMPPALQRQRVALRFRGGGLRSRVAFELGVRAMAGESVLLETGLGHDMPREEILAYLPNWFTMLVTRDGDPDQLAGLAAAGPLSVINAGPPCELMSDLQYIRRQRGRLDGLHVVCVGPVTPAARIWFEAATRWPISVTQVAPERYLAQEAEVLALNLGAAGRISTTSDLNDALGHVDVLYLAGWPSASHAKAYGELNRLFQPYQITPLHLARLGEAGIFLTHEPLSQDREVTDEALRSPLNQSVAAGNFLLHTQNAIMKLLAEGALTASAGRR